MKAHKIKEPTTMHFLASLPFNKTIYLGSYADFEVGGRKTGPWTGFHIFLRFSISTNVQSKRRKEEHHFS